MHVEKKATCGHSRKVAIYRPEREASGETKFPNNLILDFPALFKPPSAWYFAMAALVVPYAAQRGKGETILHTESTSDLSPACWNIDVYNATVWSFWSVCKMKAMVSNTQESKKQKQINKNPIKTSKTLNAEKWVNCDGVIFFF